MYDGLRCWVSLLLLRTNPRIDVLLLLRGDKELTSEGHRGRPTVILHMCMMLFWSSARSRVPS